LLAGFIKVNTELSNDSVHPVLKWLFVFNFQS